ncbi:MAG: CO dehydrogenase/CO-methylating acetyl-CoA synthase complex subunit beta, partial [Planctomycetota bacterium]
RGIQFVDGSAPGFAAIVGAAPDVQTAVDIALKCQERSLYVFMCGHHNGTTFSQQLVEGGIQLGWETRLVPFGPEITAAIYALGFASRAALSFGGVQPADSDIPEILPTGICTYEHVVSNIAYDQIVEKAIEVRGLKIKISEVPIPVPFSPAFEGERIRKEDMHCEFGGNRTPGFEWLKSADIADVEDGKIEVIGPDIDSVESGGKLPLGIVIEVAGRKMQPDFEPVLERQTHTLLNEAQGIWHMGQRNIIWVRISREAKEAGFKLEHLGSILHAMLHDQYSSIVDKVQIKIYSEEKQVLALREQAVMAYEQRDARLANMTDESVDTFYSCTLCQSFAPSHVCVITPERSGLCGAYSWLDGRAAYEITPMGPNQPLPKGNVVDDKLGQWEKINNFVKGASQGKIDQMSAYSMIVDPMTSCGCFECISALLPSTNGIMIVNREFSEMTPCGMKFSTLAGTVGGGNQVPGFIGHSKHYISSKKFISAEGGIVRIVWMPAALKEEVGDSLALMAEKAGLKGEEFLDMIADETSATTEEEVLEFLSSKGHPALTLDSMF